jgi:proteasome lid subunit RPN8/RPN11
MLYLLQTHWQTMLDEVARLDKEEACGIVAGEGQTSRAVFPVINILHSAVRFRMDPEQQLLVFNQIDEKGWELLAIFHSHLQGPSGPSSTDVAEAAYPGVIHLIWFPSGQGWACRGYLIENRTVSEVPIQIVESD